ncbi:MAG: ATP-binding protein, partial [Thermoguttaceae bacterium]|nr:ATP-binding protein [Thermoguttaceae bacterium]
GSAVLATPFDKLNAAAKRLAHTFDSLPSEGETRRNSISAPSANKPSASADSPKPARVGRFAALEDFVAGKKNRVSLNVAYSVLDMPGQYSPLLFWGDSGLGKTHLLQGIYTECVRRKIKAMYCTAEQFITQYMDALRNNTCSSNRAKFQKLRFFMLDNLDFLQGKVSTQRELHTIVSDLLANGAQVVFASTEHPRNLTGLEKSIQRLFEGGLISPLHQSEFETRLEIVRQMISQRKINLLPESIRLIASQTSGNVREIIGVLNRLEISLIADPTIDAQRLTPSAVEEILSEWVRDTNFMVSLNKIEKTVCQAFDLQNSDLKSNNRTRQYSYPRMLAMWLARKYTRKALSEIGEYFGNRSHSTVISAQKKVDKWISHGYVIDMNSKSLEISAAIQTLEDRLRRCL